MTRWLAALALVGACSKSEPKAAPPPDDRPKPTITEAELERGNDACHALVDKTCACAAQKPDKPDIAKQCELAKPLAESLRTAHEVSVTSTSSAKDIAQTEDFIRKAIKNCFEELAKLPTLGCNP